MVIILTKFNTNTSTASRSSATIVVPYTVLTDEPVESGINEVVYKIVRDDRVLIIRDGKAYDLLGNKL